jgi:DNA-binding NarL/FixJ family response regulator
MTDNIYVGIDNERVEATGKVLEQLQKDQEEAEQLRIVREAKVAARQSALAKLAALGLTEEEIAAL